MLINKLLHQPCDIAICFLRSLANGSGSWLSYSGVVRVLFPEQLRAVAERLCRCHVIHSVSILKVAMCAAGVCPGVHRRFSDSSTFSGWKETGPISRDLLPKRKIFLLWNERFWRRAYQRIQGTTAPCRTGVFLQRKFRLSSDSASNKNNNNPSIFY